VAELVDGDVIAEGHVDVARDTDLAVAASAGGAVHDAEDGIGVGGLSGGEGLDLAALDSEVVDGVGGVDRAEAGVDLLAVLDADAGALADDIDPVDVDVVEVVLVGGGGLELADHDLNIGVKAIELGLGVALAEDDDVVAVRGSP
jgi:hypothetical protein